MFAPGSACRRSFTPASVTFVRNSDMPRRPVSPLRCFRPASVTRVPASPNRCKDVQAVEAPQAGIRHTGPVQQQLLQRAQAPDVLQAGIRHLRAVEHQAGQQIEPLQVCQAGVGHRRAREDEHLQPRQAVEVLECLVGDFRVRKVDRVDGAAGAVFLELNLAAEALDLGNRLGLFFIQRRAAVWPDLPAGWTPACPCGPAFSSFDSPVQPASATARSAPESSCRFGSIRRFMELPWRYVGQIANLYLFAGSDVGWIVAFRSAKVAQIPRCFRGAKGDKGLSATKTNLPFSWQVGNLPHVAILAEGRITAKRSRLPSPLFPRRPGLFQSIEHFALWQ